MTLQQKLQYDKDTFKGLVFVSGDTVRYQASKQTGVFPVTYTVKDNLGNSASGTITITVHQKDAKNKAAPTPQDVEAQVASGQKVRIPITLTGIDVDGDDDQLLGLGNKAPQLGRITEVGANYMIYEAYEDSSGTDTFSYAVEDWTGQRAQAQVRVGVFQGASDSGVYARDDEITLRPHTAATVPVTLNDISGDNTDLTVSKKLESQGISGASVKDNMISFTTPDQAGTFYIMHTVADKAGLSDTATLTVNVDPNATIEPPTAYDYRVPSAATIDKRTVEVDVSQWIANPSGTANELKVGVDPVRHRPREGQGRREVDRHLRGSDRRGPFGAVHGNEHDVRHHLHRVHPSARIRRVPADAASEGAAAEGELARDHHHQHRRLCACGRRQDRLRAVPRIGQRHQIGWRRPLRERHDAEIHRAEGLQRSRLDHVHRGGRQGQRQDADHQLRSADPADHGHRPRSATADLLVVHDRRGGR